MTWCAPCVRPVAARWARCSTARGVVARDTSPTRRGTAGRSPGRPAWCSTSEAPSSVSATRDGLRAVGSDGLTEEEGGAEPLAPGGEVGRGGQAERPELVGHRAVAELELHVGRVD